MYQKLSVYVKKSWTIGTNLTQSLGWTYFDPIWGSKKSPNEPKILQFLKSHFSILWKWLSHNTITLNWIMWRAASCYCYFCLEPYKSPIKMTSFSNWSQINLAASLKNILFQIIISRKLITLSFLLCLVFNFSTWAIAHALPMMYP